MRWIRLVPLPLLLAVAACGSSTSGSPPDSSRVPASFALAMSDFPENYEFHDDRNLRSLDAAELGTKSKKLQTEADLKSRDPRLYDYSKLTLDYFSTDQQQCAVLLELGRRPMPHTEAGPVAPASADARSSLGYDRRTTTTLAFTVTSEQIPIEQYRQSVAGCGRFAARSQNIGQGQGAITQAQAPAGGLAYDAQAQVQSPSGVPYKLSRVLVAQPVGRYTVLGSAGRTDSAESGRTPIDQTQLRALLQKLVDKVKAG